MIAGIAQDVSDRVGVRLIEVDGRFAMRANLLEQAVREDLAAGRTPFYVCATVGTTSSTAIDPVREVARIAREFGLWLHIDAAQAGAACVCPEFRWFLDGAELADSVCFNPHKWLLTNFDCDLMWTADRFALVDALSVTPEYLRNAASDAGSVIDYRDWQIPLGRRFRALKLWFVIRHYGVEGLRSHIREHVRLAAMFESWVRSDERFEVVGERTMNLVCFRLKGGAAAGPREEPPAQIDDLNRRLMDTLNRTGRLYLTHTVLPGVGLVLRMAIGATHTREEHVHAAWDLIRESSTGLVCSG
jgi:aromatic-L-amino-acid decarboxylase